MEEVRDVRWFFREIWRHLTMPTFTPLDILIVLGALASQVNGFPEAGIALGLFCWIVLKRARVL